MTAVKEIITSPIADQKNVYLDALFSQAIRGPGTYDRQVFAGIGERRRIFDGQSPIAASHYIKAIELGLFDTTKRASNPFANEFQEAAKANTLAAIKGIDISSPDGPRLLIEHSTTFLSACTDIMERLINLDKPDHALHNSLAQAIQWFGGIDSKRPAQFVANPTPNRLNRGRVFDPNKLDQKYIQSLAAINATFDFLEQCAPPIDEDMRKRVLNAGYNVQVWNIGNNYGATCPSLLEIDRRATNMLANEVANGTQMVSLPENKEILCEDPSVHLASRALLCANALFVRKNLPDQGHAPYKSRIEVMPDGLRVLFCRTIDPNNKKDKELEGTFRGVISGFHNSYIPVNPRDGQTNAAETINVPSDQSAIDCRIRGSTAAIADNTKYQIEPDESLIALGVSQISIEMQGNVYMVNIITAQGTNTITLSPDELSGLITNIVTTSQGMASTMVELIAKLAIAKTKEWISSQYNYDPDTTSTDNTGIAVAKRSPHLELLPLGSNCAQYGNPDREREMSQKYGTTPGDLNDALVLAQIGWDNLKSMPPHIARMVEELILRAMERGSKSGYTVDWHDRQNHSDPVLYGNGYRVYATGLDKLQNGEDYDPDRHFFQVSFVPGIYDGTKKEISLVLDFSELATGQITSHTPGVAGTVFQS